MDDERTCVSRGRGMFRSQPDLEMSEGAVPVKYLDDEGECKAREMEYLGHLILDSPEGAPKKEHNPEEMNENNGIRKDLIEHSYFLREPPIVINSSLPRRRESRAVETFWIPAFAGMTFLEVTLIFNF
jgi:hypothetical protein